MPASIVRANYPELVSISRTFQQNAENLRASLQQLRDQQATLESGDWLGNGAQAFYVEMNSQVVPTFNRLLRALEAAGQTTTAIEKLMHQTEDECARLLTANGNGAAGGLNAMAGSLGGLAAAGPAIGAALNNAAGGNGNAGSPPATAKPGPDDAAPFAMPAGMRSFLPQATNGLPDPSQLRYYGDAKNPDGSLRPVPGSRANALWTKRLAQQLPGINAQRAQLDDAKAVLAETMQEQAAAVAAARKTMQKVMDKLGKDGYELVKQYQSLGRDARVADSNVEAAGLKLGAAQNRLESIKAQNQYYDANKNKLSWESKRDEINKAIKERQELVGKVVDMGKSIATGDAKGAAFDQGAELIKTVIGGMTDAEMKQLIAAESNIEQYQAVMDKASARVLSEQTAATQKDLSAAQTDFNTAQQVARNTERNQRDTLDQLANLERQKKAGTLFQELQRYDDQVRTVGESVRSQNADYLKTLNRDDLAGADRRYAEIGADIRHVEQTGGGPEAWFDDARNAQSYQAQLGRWQKSEVAAATQLEREMRQGQHLTLIDETMTAIDRSQGGNPYDEGLVRPQPTRP